MSCGSFSEPDLSSFLEFSSAGGGRHCHALISFHFFSLLVPCSRPVELFTASPSQHGWRMPLSCSPFFPLFSFQLLVPDLLSYLLLHPVRIGGRTPLSCPFFVPLVASLWSYLPLHPVSAPPLMLIDMCWLEAVRCLRLHQHYSCPLFPFIFRMSFFFLLLS